MAQRARHSDAASERIARRRIYVIEDIGRQRKRARAPALEEYYSGRRREWSEHVLYHRRDIQVVLLHTRELNFNSNLNQSHQSFTKSQQSHRILLNHNQINRLV